VKCVHKIALPLTPSCLRDQKVVTSVSKDASFKVRFSFPFFEVFFLLTIGIGNLLFTQLLSHALSVITYGLPIGCPSFPHT
jgi:hypothetical protein